MRLLFYQKRQKCRSDIRATQNGHHDMRSTNYYVHQLFRLPFVPHERHLLKVPNGSLPLPSLGKKSLLFVPYSR